MIKNNKNKKQKKGRISKHVLIGIQQIRTDLSLCDSI